MFEVLTAERTDGDLITLQNSPLDRLTVWNWDFDRNVVPGRTSNVEIKKKWRNQMEMTKLIHWLFKKYKYITNMKKWPILSFYTFFSKFSYLKFSRSYWSLQLLYIWVMWHARSWPHLSLVCRTGTHERNHSNQLHFWPVNQNIFPSSNNITTIKGSENITLILI